MAFTTWAALRTAMLDAYADHIATGNFVASYTKGDRQIKYKTESEFLAALQMTYKMEALESPGNPATMVSYGRMRRF